jgi:hypothetical protein
LSSQSDPPAHLISARRESIDARFDERQDQIKGLRACVELLERARQDRRA